MGSGECCVVTKWWLIIGNIFVFLGGLAILGVGIWIKIEFGDFVRFDTQTAFNYVHGCNILIGAGVITLIISSIGFYGAFKECRKLLLLYGFIILAIMILEMILVALANIYKGKVEETAYSVFKKTLQEEYGQEDNEGIKIMADKFMEKYSCCGVNNYTDWQRSYFSQGRHDVVPDSCCKKEKDDCGKNFTVSEINQKGCWDDFLHMARGQYSLYNGLALGIGLGLINPLIAAFTLAHYIKTGRPI